MAFHLCPQPKPTPRVIVKHKAQKTDDAHERAVKAEVDRRDGKRCRCCTRRGNPEALTTIGKIHRAHIQDASRSGPYEAWNLCSLCWICHSLEHAKQLWFVGTDANELTLGFEIHEAAVVEVFGTSTLPRHVRIVLG